MLLRRTRPEIAPFTTLSPARLSISLFLATTALAHPVLAQESATRLAPVTVSGSDTSAEADNATLVPTRATSALKTATPLVETPRSISVITREELVDRAVQDMIEAVRYTAGVTTGAFGFDPRFDQIYIRGYDLTTTGDFRDGLRQPYMNYGTFRTEPYGVERLEIIKGPTSVTYGAAGPGGIINRISKLPKNETHGEVELQYGTIGRAHGAFDIGGPLADDGSLLYRLVGVARKGESDYEIADERLLLQPSVTWAPDDTTRLTIYGLGQKDETDVNVQTFKHKGDVLRFSDPLYDRQRVEQFQTGYMFEHEFDGGLTFRQHARYSHLYTDGRYLETASTTGSVMHRMPVALTDEQNVFQVDNQLEARVQTGPVEHTLLGGLDYTRITSDFGLGYGTVQSKYDFDIDSPTYGMEGATPALTYFSGLDMTQTGVYLQDQIAWGNWRAVAGLRHDWVSQTASVSDVVTNGKDDRALSGQLGLLYLFDNGVAPYVSYGTSFLPVNNVDINGSILDPRDAYQVEAGVKYQPEGEPISLTTAVYQIVDQNIPRYVEDLTVPSGYYYRSIGEVTTRGFEAELRKEFDIGLSLIAAYNYNVAEITASENAAVIGNAPSTTPRHIASLWAQYAFQEDTTLAGLSLGAGIRFNSESYTSEANTTKNAEATYLDASVGYDFGAANPDLKGLNLTLSATNIADDRKQVCTDGYCYVGRGRTFLGTLRYSW